MLINDDTKLDYSDVLIRPKRSTLTSRFDVEVEREYTFKHSQRSWTGIPIMASNMDTVGTYRMAEALYKHNMITCLAKHCNTDGFWEWPREDKTALINIDVESIRIAKEAKRRRIEKKEESANYCCVMGGISSKDMKNTQEIYKSKEAFFIGLDVANGYTISFVDAVKRMRDLEPDATIIAGNVVTADMTQELILAGADIVKVGIGPGSVCTTRIKTGIGMPQLSAVIECADAAHGMNAHIIADGGCNTSGDIVKAFAAGADFVMIGGMLAGHDECDGELIDGKMNFYGMASESAMDRHKVRT